MSYLAQLGYAGYRLGKKPGLNPASQVTPNDLSVFLATSFVPYQILTYAVHGGEEKKVSLPGLGGRSFHLTHSIAGAGALGHAS